MFPALVIADPSNIWGMLSHHTPHGYWGRAARLLSRGDRHLNSTQRWTNGGCESAATSSVHILPVNTKPKESNSKSLHVTFYEVGKKIILLYNCD